MKRMSDGAAVPRSSEFKAKVEDNCDVSLGNEDVNCNHEGLNWSQETDLVRTIVQYESNPSLEGANELVKELCGTFELHLVERKNLNLQVVSRAIEDLSEVQVQQVMNQRHYNSLNTLLHYLCKLNVLELVCLFLRNSLVDVDARNGSLSTPLTVVAMSHQSLTMAEVLLKRGANPWLCNEHELSAIHYAARFHNRVLLDMMFEYLSPPQRRVSFSVLECCTEYSEEDLTLMESCDARFDMIRSLLTDRRVINDVSKFSGDSLLMICCRKSLSRQVHLLIELGADCEIVNYNGESAVSLSRDKDWFDVISKQSYERLWTAVSRNNLNEISRLVKVGVDVNRCNSENDFALAAAIRSSSNETVALMIQSCGADVNITFKCSNCDGIRPLLLAASTGLVGKLSLLMDAGALIDVRTSAGDTMLHLMAREGHIEALKVGVYKALNKNAPLLMDLVNSLNADNLTSVMVAAANKHRDCVDFLSAAGSLSTKIFQAALLRSVGQPPPGDDVMDAAETDSGRTEFGESKVAASTAAVTVSGAVTSAVLPVVAPPVEETIAKMLKRTSLELTYHACKFGMTEIVRRRLQNELIVSQINQNVMDTNYVMIKDVLTEVITAEPCLYVSCYYGHLQIVTDLLEKGANANSCARNGWSCLFVASKKNYLEIVKLLLLRSANVLAKNRNDMTSINIAAYHGNLEVVRVLLQYKADVNSGDKLGARPLHAAIQSGRCDICELLLDFGADVNAVTSSGVCGLYVASYSGNEQIVELLLSYKPPAAFASQLKCVDIDAMNKEGLTPLIVAAFNGHVHVMKRLLAAGADLSKTEKKKVTAIYAACQNGHIDAVKLLIDTGADPNIPIGNGNTCIHACAIENKLDIVTLLAQQSAKIDEINVDGVTPLYLACEKGHIESVTMLIGMGANVNVMTKNSVSPINISSQNGHAAVVKKLIKSGAFVDSQSSNGTTPLYMAAQNGHTEVCRLLLEAGADVDIRSKDKETAVFVSGYFGHTQIVKLLIDYRVQINIVDRDTRTPLWWACKAGREDVVKLLMDAGADVNISDREYVTPTMVAAKERHSRVCELLSGARVQATLCAICLTNQRCVLFLPCKHLASCADCWLKLERTQSRKCPLCRIDISDVVTVYT